jgi:acyl-CoA synthetase (AMP-forming)/AMP-acid ligase II
MRGTSTRPKRRRLSPSIIIAMTALLVAASGGAYATVSSVPPTITACAHHNSGELYLAHNCLRRDRRLRWNVVGPPGPTARPAGGALSGTYPSDRRIEEQCAQQLGSAFGQGYAMTESSGAIALPDVALPEQIVPGTAGRLLPGTVARAIDPDTGAGLVAGAGAAGELLIRGPQPMRGYRGRPDATAATIDYDGWLHIGDLGTVSSDGAMRITDRLKELIKVKGFQVAPAELEGLLRAHPYVADAGVIGVPDETAGEPPKACIFARGEVVADDLIGWIAAHVAPHKRIRAVEVLEEISRLPSGNILRRPLHTTA